MIPDKELDGPPARTLTHGAKADVLARWNRLCLIYNLVLAVETILISAGGGFADWADPEFRTLIVSCGLMANLCFCLGPIVNLCFDRARPDREGKVTRFLFAGGLTLSVVLTYLILVGWGMSRI